MSSQPHNVFICSNLHSGQKHVKVSLGLIFIDFVPNCSTLWMLIAVRITSTHCYWKKKKSLNFVTIFWKLIYWNYSAYAFHILWQSNSLLTDCPPGWCVSEVRFMGKWRCWMRKSIDSCLIESGVLKNTTLRSASTCTCKTENSSWFLCETWHFTAHIWQLTFAPYANHLKHDMAAMLISKTFLEINFLCFCIAWHLEMYKKEASELSGWGNDMAKNSVKPQQFN